MGSALRGGAAGRRFGRRFARRAGGLAAAAAALGMVVPAPWAQASTPVPTLVVAANASFDAFDAPANGAPYRASVFYDLTPSDPNDNQWAPLVGAYVEMYLDANGSPADGFEAIQCAGVADASGQVSCSPPRRLTPRVRAETRQYAAVLHNPAPSAYADSHDVATATFAGVL